MRERRWPPAEPSVDSGEDREHTVAAFFGGAFAQGISFATALVQALADMKVRVSGKQFEIGEVLPEQVKNRLQTVIAKHFDGGAESNVVFSHEGFGFRADCTTHLDSGVVLKAEGQAADAYHAFDAALSKLQNQIKRYKRRLKGHHEKSRAKAPDA